MNTVMGQYEIMMTKKLQVIQMHMWKTGLEKECISGQMNKKTRQIQQNTH